jgi:hypothetical protein
MFDATIKDLDQKTVVIKGVPPATRSRAFVLWLALLVLYFLLLPTAAEAPNRGAEISSSDPQVMSVVAGHPHYASASRR